MNQGVQTIIYPVNDIAKAKAMFRALLGVEPYADEAYYVGFKVGGQDIGLDPHGHRHGVTAYFHVDNIEQCVQSLVDAGAQVVQPIKDVGGNTLIAAFRDTDGNIVGLRQVP